VSRTKSDYALLWANGMTFGEVYDLMKEDIEAEIGKGWCPEGSDCSCDEEAESDTGQPDRVIEIAKELTSEEIHKMTANLKEMRVQVLGHLAAWAGEDGAEPVNTR